MKKKLLDINNILQGMESEEETKVDAVVVRSKSKAEHATKLSIAKMIAEAKGGNDVHFVSKNELNLHELAEAALKGYEHCTLTLCTYSLTELPARKLAAWKDSKILKELNVLIDFRAKNNYPGVEQMLKNIANSHRYTPIHAKAMVIEHHNWKLCIIGSANWTKNPRFEIGMITADHKIANFMKEWMINAIVNDGKE